MVVPIHYTDKDMCYAVRLRGALGNCTITITARSTQEALEKAEAFGTPERADEMHAASKHYGQQREGTREELFKTLVVLFE